MKNPIMPPADAGKRIEAGAMLFAAGSRTTLSALPRGKSIGGTSVCCMTETGGRTDCDNVFVTEIADATDARAVLCEGKDLPDIAIGRFGCDMTMLVIPAFAPAHQNDAINCASYPRLFEQPVMGWFAGVPRQYRPRQADGVRRHRRRGLRGRCARLARGAPGRQGRRHRHRQSVRPGCGGARDHLPRDRFHRKAQSSTGSRSIVPAGCSTTTSTSPGRW